MGRKEIVDSSRNIFPIQEKMSMYKIRIISATKQINFFFSGSRQPQWIFIDGILDKLFFWIIFFITDKAF